MDTIRFIHREVCCFDLEFVPDTDAGRRILKLPPSMPEWDVMERMSAAFGDGTERNIMKQVFYRVVSIAAVVRKMTAEGVRLSLISIPTDDNFDESAILTRFLTYIGEQRPQLVGYASHTFDIPALWQRAIVHKINTHGFCQRPAKPWEDYADYFAGKGASNDYNVDLLKIVGNFGNTVPKLEQIAGCCRIPSKLGMSGAEVAPAWLADKRCEIVDYNECDALTTYLLWLQLVETQGLLTAEQIVEERLALEALLETRREHSHIEEFLNEWKRLNDPSQVPAFDDAAVEVQTETADPPVNEDNSKSLPPPPFFAHYYPNGTVNPMSESLMDLISSKQLGFIRDLCEQKHYNAEEITHEFLRCKVDELSKRAASDVIDYLKAAPKWVDPNQQSLLDVPAVDENDFEWIENVQGTTRYRGKVLKSGIRPEWTHLEFSALDSTVTFLHFIDTEKGFENLGTVKLADLRMDSLPDDDIPF